MSLDAAVRRKAFEVGFHAVGVARAGSLDEDGRRLEDWLSRGFHAGMTYMERWREVRLDPRRSGMLEGARSVVSLALAYPRPAGGPGLAGRLAGFARGPDYHRVVRRMAGRLLDELRREAPGLRGRLAVDSAPVLERAWAARAGLGWIGRNGCLVHETLGSWLVLGELILATELEADSPVPDRCGSCRACIEACPTGALAPDRRTLDARRCLSYWTVEAREPPPPELEARAVLFGCDRCQLACPFGRQRGPASPLEPLARWAGLGLSDLAAAELAEVASWIEGTALERAGAAALRERARRLLDPDRG